MARVGLFGQMSEIQPHLYLSGAGVLRPDALRSKRINCIVNATTEEPNGYVQGIDYVKVRVEDSPSAPLGMYFDSVADRIHANKERGDRTLVHCVAGVSRSASLCIIYLMKYGGMTLKQAYRHVKTIRPIVRPNVGFWQQMIEYEKRTRGHNTVQMITIDGKSLDGHLSMVPDVYVDEYRARQQANGSGGLADRSRSAAGKVGSRSASVGPARRTVAGLLGQHGSVSPAPAHNSGASAFSYTPTMSSSSYSRSTGGTLARASGYHQYGSLRYGAGGNGYAGAWTFTANSPSRRSSLIAYGASGAGLYSSGRHTTALTPVRSRAKENLFSNLYHSTHSLLHPAFGI